MMEKDKLVQLVLDVQSGKETAIAEMYDCFYEDIYYYIFKTVKDADLAADLTQDTFMEIYQTIGTLREPAAFVRWSKKVAYHKCTAYFRKKKDVLVEETEDGMSIFETVVEEREEFIPDAALDQDEFKKAIKEMIDSLPMEQRAAIMMRYFDELSVKEIAEIQGVTEGTVKSRLNYARKSIKSSVEFYEEKHGIKIHCKGVVPLLLWLFKDSQDASGISLAAQTMAVTAEEGVKEAARAFWEKFVIGASVVTVAAVAVMPVKETKYQDKDLQEVVYEHKIEDFKLNSDSEKKDFDMFILYELYGDFITGGCYEISRPDPEEEEWQREHIGIVSYDLVAEAAMAATGFDEMFYAAYVEAVDTDAVSVLVEEIKANIQPQEWQWYDVDTDTYKACWQDVSVEEFQFHINGKYILISYVDEEFATSKGFESYEELQTRFDKILNAKRELYGEQ